MPKLDLTVTVSVIIALCAIISPILTSIINNRYQFKIRKLENQQHRFETQIAYRQKIFEDYLRSAGKCMAYVNTDSLREYQQYYQVALLYASDEIREQMISTNTSMQKRLWNDVSKKLEKLTPMIHAMLQKL